jgi:hypothetical protein
MDLQFPEASGGFDHVGRGPAQSHPLHGVAFLSGFDTPSLQAQGRQRGPSYFNIPKNIPQTFRPNRLRKLFCKKIFGKYF